MNNQLQFSDPVLTIMWFIFVVGNIFMIYRTIGWVMIEKYNTRVAHLKAVLASIISLAVFAILCITHPF